MVVSVLTEEPGRFPWLIEIKATLLYFTITGSQQAKRGQWDHLLYIKTFPCYDFYTWDGKIIVLFRKFSIYMSGEQNIS